MRHFDIVIFDVDGTLLDTSEGVLASVVYTIEQHGLPMLSEKELKSFIGPPIQNSFSKAYGITDTNKLQEIAGTFRNRYKDHDLLKAVPYDGITDVCGILKKNGVKIAVATYKREDYAVRIMEHFRFSDYASVIHGADHENKLKKRDIIRLCLSESGFSTEESYKRAVMVGDSDNDLAGADDIGTAFIGVTYGFGFAPGCGATGKNILGFAGTPDEILKYIL